MAAKKTQKKPRRYWNYRVIRHNPAVGEMYFAIHEVHYDGDKPVAMTATPIDVGSDSLEGIEWMLDRMKQALAKPVLTEADIGSGVPYEHDAGRDRQGAAGDRRVPAMRRGRRG